jgi:hypothetical protein
MGREGFFWSVDECRWLPCPQPVTPVEVVVPEPRESAARPVTSSEESA